MKERPILFNSEMVRAVLDGRKTQTRRVTKFTPETPLREPFCSADDDMHWTDWFPSRTDGTDHRRGYRCPFGVVGDRLWVRETHAYVFRGSRNPGPYSGEEMGVFCETTDSDTFHVEYAATVPEVDWEHGFRPSIHMPRWASRITLEITNVRVERVQEISEEDAKAEGAQPMSEDGALGWGQYDGTHPSCYNFRWGFKRIWNDAYGERDSWGLNPWVWAITFKVLK